MWDQPSEISERKTNWVETPQNGGQHLFYFLHQDLRRHKVWDTKANIRKEEFLFSSASSKQHTSFRK